MAGGRRKEDYVSFSLPSIERRSLMESGMRRQTTPLDVAVVVVFFIVLAVILAYFLTPLLTRLVNHIPDLVTNTGH